MGLTNMIKPKELLFVLVMGVLFSICIWALATNIALFLTHASLITTNGTTSFNWSTNK